MRIYFKNSSYPARAVKRLKKLTGLPDAIARQWTATVLGYRDWHELYGQLGAHPPSLFDEELDQAAFAARRSSQSEHLDALMAAEAKRAVVDPTVMARVISLNEAVPLLPQWTPSAIRPSRRRSLGDIVNETMAERGLTDLEVAKRSGLSVGTIRDIREDYVMDPRYGTLKALFAGLGISDPPPASAAMDPAPERVPVANAPKRAKS